MDSVPGEKRPPTSVTVIGGGLAGISAACELADLGFQVSLLEKRPFLGGRTFSYYEKEIGVDIDNGQHVFMKCCASYIALLKKLDVWEKMSVQSDLRVPVINDGKTSYISSVTLPGPLHLLPSLLTYNHLSFIEKLAVCSTMLKIMRTNWQDDQDLDSISFHAWLKQHKQSYRAITNLWNLIILPTCNETAEHVSAGQAIMVIKVGFLASRHGTDIGYSKVGLSRLLADEAQRYIEGRGGSVVFGAELKAFNFEGDTLIDIELKNGEKVRSDYFVSALQFENLREILPPNILATDYFSPISNLKSSPIVNVHLWFDKKVTDFEFAAYLGSDVQWVFNKSAILGLKDEGQYLVITISGAHTLVETNKDELLARVVTDLQRLIPATKLANLKQSRIVKELGATFTPAPGAAKLRPTARTPFTNLALAGEWTATGWPSTMESATLSGKAAAQAIVELSKNP
ncbi:MAG: FAD-dependent oxidoreductase [Dehalococcoidia bacterium]|nr:FAD-dependent oxidoreductase [Dehalococcoidia bacterium]